MRLIVIDVFPALLSWEGRGASGGASAGLGAREAISILADAFRLVAVADGDITGRELRDLLSVAGIDHDFTDIVTSASSGPTVTPRVVRKVARDLGVAWDHVIMVTARPPLARSLRGERVPTILTEHADQIGTVPEAIERLFSGPLNP
ncbi:hypothetical protein HQ535_15175 [bacterium]|nr:hypothetical protein [bacterium]